MVPTSTTGKETTILFMERLMPVHTVTRAKEDFGSTVVKSDPHDTEYKLQQQ